MWRFCRDADDPAVPPNQIRRFGVHDEAEGRQRAAVLGHKVEEIPLRHERHELAAARHVSEIGKLQDGLTEAGAQLANFVVRDFQEIVEQSEFVDDT